MDTMLQSRVREEPREWPAAPLRLRDHPTLRRERFPGELALADLRPDLEPPASLRVVTRFVVVRFAARAADDAGAPGIEEERRVAAEYALAARGLVDEAEWLAWCETVQLAGAASAAELVPRLTRLAAAAWANGDEAGGVACARLGLALARDGHAFGHGARLARMLAGRCGDRPEIAALWLRRAHRLAHRAG